MAIETTDTSAPEPATASPWPTSPPPARTDVRPPGTYRAVLANPAFRRLWLVQLVAALGEALASVAMPLLAYDITGSAGLVGLVFVVQQAPKVLLAPIAGVLADRVNRRGLMLGADLGRAAAVLPLPFVDSAWQVAALAALVAVGSAVSRPAELAAVPMVVAPGELVGALSVSQVTNALVRVAGPGIGAGVVGLAGPGPAFWLQSLCFLASAAFLWRLVLPPMARAPVADRGLGGLVALARREAAEGLRIVRTNPVVRGISAVEALWQLVVGVFFVAMVVYVDESLRLGDDADTVFALLLGTLGAGTAVGALAAGRVERRIGRPRLMAIGYLAPLMLVPAGITPPLAVIFGCWFALGFTDAWAVIAMQAYLAESVPNELRGRIYATFGGIITLAAAIGFGLVGWATDVLGPPATMVAVGTVVGVGGPLLLFATGALAALRRDAPTVE